MAIVFLSLAYAPLIGGAERQAQALLEGWAREGQEIWLLTRRVPGRPDQETIGGVQVFRLWSMWLPVLSWLTFSISVLLFLFPRWKRVDSLWSVMFNVSTLAAVLSGWSFRRPVVVKISCSGTGGNIQEIERSPGGWLATALLQGCRAVIILNEETLRELRPHSVPAEKIKRIPNGVDCEVFRPAAAEERRRLRDRLGIALSQVAVLAVGRLELQKNYLHLLTAWTSLSSQCPSARLLIMGEGSQGPALQQQMELLRLGESVRFLGPRADVREIYQACDLFILPSWYEGLSNALLEAMACELPAAVSRIPGNTDVIQSEKDGLLLDPSKPSEWVAPVARWIQDEPLRRDFGRRARQIVQERFSLSTVLKEYQTLARSLDSALTSPPAGVKR